MDHIIRAFTVVYIVYLKYKIHFSIILYYQLGQSPKHIHSSGFLIKILNILLTFKEQVTGRAYGVLPDLTVLIFSGGRL